MENLIKIRGARQHNLKNVDLDIPKNKLVVFTGVSGSGKSSMAFDTIFAEGQRRYVESLATYARQFLGVMDKPDVDTIEGLSPSISIDQKTTTHNPRSTVGTITEIYDYLRLLYARIGHPHCPICGREITGQSLDQIVDDVISLVKERNFMTRILILSPIVKDRKGEYSGLFANLKAKGFRKIRIDGEVKDIDEDFVLIKTNKHNIEVIIDRLSINTKDLKKGVDVGKLKSRLSDSIEQSLKLSDGLVIVSFILEPGFEIPDRPKKMLDHLFSERFACPIDNIQFPEIEPRTFSFNSPHGACPECSGIGKNLKVDPKLIFSEDLTILEGGILPFSSMFEKDTWYSRLILKVCDEYNINIKISIRNLTESQKNILLNGTGDEIHKVRGNNRYGRITNIFEEFKGIVGEIERRYKDTKTDYLREGIEKYMREIVCISCNGSRLNKGALAISVTGKSINEISSLQISEIISWIKHLEEQKILSYKETEISKVILKEISVRLSFLKAIGLSYLTLDRNAGTLAGGEAQRIRLASQIGSGLTGVLYVLDEPTVGLHNRDSQMLINTLKRLKDMGNSVIVVEHDRDMIKSGDYVVDFGPFAGKKGGKVVAIGNPLEISKNAKSLTGKYLSGRLKVEIKKSTKVEIFPQKYLTIKGCSQYNLKNITVTIPLRKFIAITGVSGSGKSTLLVETIYYALESYLNPFFRQVPGAFEAIEGHQEIDRVILIDQSPIGRTPRSNPATYTKVFDLIRGVYSQTHQAKSRGYKKGRFSFNVKGGRCENCEGQGQIKIEMQFMSDIWITCEVCNGKRYNRETLEVNYKGKSIFEVLCMTVSEAREFFNVYRDISNKLETLEQVGLGYMDLGQSATTLSGGEAQRVKLASELGKRVGKNTIYFLDEPTTGLHFADIGRLLQVLNLLVEKGNTVIIIEHNLDVIKNTDWIIDLGPDGGEQGGKIIAEGTPQMLAKTKFSYTGQYLKLNL